MPLTQLLLKTDSDVVKTEGPNRFSRDEDILTAGGGPLLPGAVLGQVTASGKFVLLAPAANDGSQNAVKVLLQKADATAADVRVVTLARHAEVVLQSLVWPAGITAPQKSAALAALQGRGIVARMGV